MDYPVTVKSYKFTIKAERAHREAMRKRAAEHAKELRDWNKKK